MSDQKQYHQHIERAIQNVLSKVKSPELAQRASAPKTRLPQKQEPAERPPSQEEAESDLPEHPKTPSEDKAATGDTNETTSEAAPVYLEAEDLYTPIALEEDEDEDEASEAEPPLIEDTYSAPYNLFEEFVETELNILLSRYLDLCRCSQCRADIVALSLQQLPAYYVTGTRGTLTAKSVVWTRYMQEVMDAVTKSIHIVYKRPRNTCRKIKQVLWVRPDLEDVSSSEANQNLFANLASSEPELIFSPEIEALIQTIESLPEEARQELLPASALPSSGSPDESDTISTSGTVEMNLLDIDEWEATEEKMQ